MGRVQTHLELQYAGRHTLNGTIITRALLACWLSAAAASCSQEPTPDLKAPSPGTAAEAAASAAAVDADRSPQALFESYCQTCHDGSVPRAPHQIVFQMLGADAIYESLSRGVMMTQAAELSDHERRALASHLGGATAGPTTPVLRCDDAALAASPADSLPAPDGWGLTLTSARYLAADVARLDARDVPRLELKWAFAYPNASRARSQPAYFEGRIYVGSQDGTVYALDLETGCAHWTYQAGGEVRSAISVTRVGDSTVAFFGDINGEVYAVDTQTGATRWRVRADAHADTTITGSPRLYGDTLYVPLSSREWASAADPAYPCCTFRGGVTALDTTTGEPRWTTYSIAEPPELTGTFNDHNVPQHHPAGAPVWNSPTIDARRNRLYIGTGEAYTSPAADTSDSVLAMDLDTGELVWSFQATAGDAWNMACFIGGGSNCPEEDGPDLDIGAPPMLMTVAGRDVLVVGQKSGDLYALDPDANGALLWNRKIGRGGFAGGVHWGMANDGTTVYAPNADTIFTGRFTGERKPGLFAIDPATGDTVWFTPAPEVCAAEDKPACDPGLSAAPTAIPGIVFAGSFDGHLRAYDAESGAIVWDFDTNRSFETVNGDTAHGGSLESDGPIVIDGIVFANSGYLFGDRMPGNVLLAFEARPSDDD